jgi:hypothetical protein
MWCLLGILQVNEVIIRKMQARTIEVCLNAANPKPQMDKEEDNEASQ